jgi:hypothetical protein
VAAHGVKVMTTNIAMSFDTKVKGILIDPFTRVVSLVPVGEVLDIFDILEAPRECQLSKERADLIHFMNFFDVTLSNPLIDESDALCITNELITARQYFVVGNIYFGGKALIVGVTRKGLISTGTLIEDVRDLVRYARPARLDEEPLFCSDVDGIDKPWVIDEGPRKRSPPRTNLSIEKEDTMISALDLFPERLH